MSGNFEFVNPEFFWLFLILPVLVLWYLRKRHQQQPSFEISTIQGFKVKKDLLSRSKPILFILRLLALSAIIVALARPRIVDESTRTSTTQGIDIIMSMDLSASMLARDLKPNRLEALKATVAQFIKARPNDRIGLVEYAGESYTRTPLTSDKELLLKSLSEMNYNTVIKGGTAIGSGLATAVNRLKDSPSKSKVIILLTDGMNNTGVIDPKTASQMAVQYGIKVYTIGLGTNGMAMSPVAVRPDGSFQYGHVQVEIDEELMKEIAAKSGGLYFRATDNKKLESIYEDINKLETTEVEEFRYTHYEEKFRPWALAGLALLGLEFLLRISLFRGFI